VCVLILWLYRGLSGPCWGLWVSVVTSEDANMSEHGTTGKRKYVMLAITQKLHRIWRLESGENQREVVTSYRFGLSTVYDIKKEKTNLWSFMASNESVKGFFRPETLREPKLAQLDKVLCKWSRVLLSEGPGIVPSITERAKSFFD